MLPGVNSENKKPPFGDKLEIVDLGEGPDPFISVWAPPLGEEGVHVGTHLLRASQRDDSGGAFPTAQWIARGADPRADPRADPS